jgi:hypothetical protein
MLALVLAQRRDHDRDPTYTMLETVALEGRA